MAWVLLCPSCVPPYLFPLKVLPKVLGPDVSYGQLLLVSLTVIFNHTWPGSPQAPLGICDLEMKDF